MGVGVCQDDVAGDGRGRGVEEFDIARECV